MEGAASANPKWTFRGVDAHCCLFACVVQELSILTSTKNVRSGHKCTRFLTYYCSTHSRYKVDKSLEVLERKKCDFGGRLRTLRMYRFHEITGSENAMSDTLSGI